MPEPHFGKNECPFSKKIVYYRGVSDCFEKLDYWIFL